MSSHSQRFLCGLTGTIAMLRYLVLWFCGTTNLVLGETLQKVFQVFETREMNFKAVLDFGKMYVDTSKHNNYTKRITERNLDFFKNDN